MVYKLHKNGSFNIHTIRTDRFKNIRMEIMFRNNIDVASVHKRTVLFDMFMETSEHYKTKRDISLKLEELYNAVCYATTIRMGNVVLSSIALDFLNPQYTDEDYLSEAIKLPFDLIFHPDVNDNEFNSETLEVIKTRIKSDIKCLHEDPQKSAIIKGLKAFDKDSVSSINLSGTEEKIDEITSSSLYETYKEILTHDYIDIFIIGDFDENEVLSKIVEYASFKTIKTHEITMEVKNKIAKKTKEIVEESHFSQSQVLFILNTLDLSDYEKKYPFIIYNMILGGGSLETKLYHTLRDENSLCYNVQSLFQKNDNLELIITAVDKSNENKTKSLINSTIKAMENNVSADEVKRAVSAILSSINMSLDSPDRIIDTYLFQYLNSIDDIETRINEFKKVTKNDVMKIAKKVKLNTIYILRGGEENGDN